MSSLAVIAQDAGIEVTGSDEDPYPPASTVLETHHVHWFNGYNTSNLGSPDIVVLGNHIRHDNPELLAAMNRDIQIISYPQFVQLLFKQSNRRIVIAGAHGKSTTTAMIGWILVEAGLDPTILIGAESRNLHSGYRAGNRQILVIEGDEYSSSCIDTTPKFNYYQATDAIITSVELDHVDLYQNDQKQITAYTQFCRTIRPNGKLLLCTDSIVPISLNLPSNFLQVQTYGLENNPNWHVASCKFQDGESHFSVIHDEIPIAEFVLHIPGRHNIQNAVAAIAMCLEIGIPPSTVQSALLTFEGVSRRFEIIGEINSVTVIEDYAHHPTAIRKTLEAARSRYPDRRIWCIYEPHTYTRIKGLLDKFENAFENADEVIISDIYAAREKSLIGLVHSKDIVNTARKQKDNISYVPTPGQVYDCLIGRLKHDDVLIFMSVGRFGGIPEKLVQHLRESSH